ncbi:hypothetical protein AB0G86_25060 [Streptomyces scabiei]|uniref:hypothetical protein n=1 Tax=Streptomyces scabiei TaxID=1930 RepID=UPI0033D1F4C4
MAKTPVVVTEEDYKADPENVQLIETPIPGFPDAAPLVTYIKVQHIDDLTGKPADGIETVSLLVPVEAERETVERDAEGDPVKNDDGSDKIKVEKYTDFEARELDLSPASLKKLMTALKPFYEKSRPRVVSVPAARPAAASSGPNPELSAWNRRVKAWLETNRPEYGVKANTKGRVKGEHETLYAQQNPTDPKPV